MCQSYLIQQLRPLHNTVSINRQSYVQRTCCRTDTIKDQICTSVNVELSFDRLADPLACNKKAGPPLSKAARLSVKIRCFPSLPYGRFGFVYISMNETNLVLLLYQTLTVGVKSGEIQD